MESIFSEVFDPQKSELESNFCFICSWQMFEKYRENFEEFLHQVHQIAGDVLITSPSDFTGLNHFLEKKSS